MKNSILIITALLFALNTHAGPFRHFGNECPADATCLIVSLSPSITVTNVGGVYYLNVPAPVPGIASSLSWNVPQMYGGGSWSFGCTGYIPDAVLQYQGPDGNAFVMFPPEGGMCLNGGVSDDGTTGAGLGVNNFTRPTVLKSLVVPAGTPEDTRAPKFWFKIVVNGTNGFIPVYQ